ncbi:putative double-stranded beta-helix domain-containing protein [Salinisphaera sp. PC39]|uniref:(R)-mandelonitrile lyase n=1 Tax=Salinisphaera sp. PC39 TaxID=1304156 RepID=UPI0033405989
MTHRALIAAACLIWTGGAFAQGMQVSQNGDREGYIGPDDYFTGTAYVEPLFSAGDSFRSNGASVTFLPGARSHWHTHPAGQVLIVTEGTGWVQAEDGEKRIMRPGDVIRTPPGVKHWHGATDTNAVTHLAIQQLKNGENVIWKEPVTDRQYNGGAAE